LEIFDYVLLVIEKEHSTIFVEKFKVNVLWVTMLAHYGVAKPVKRPDSQIRGTNLIH